MKNTRETGRWVQTSPGVYTPALASTGVAALTARGAKDKKEAAAAAGESTALPALSLNKLSELKGRDPDAPMATPRKDAPETSRRKKAGMSEEGGDVGPAPSSLKIQMPKLVIPVTSDGAELERPALRDSDSDLHA